MRQDLTGKIIGQLTVIEYAGNIGPKQYGWLCQCSCGKKIKVSTSSLNSKEGNRSCGCLKAKINKELDLTGKTIRNIKAVRKIKAKTKDRLIQYLCICYCGKEFISSGKDLRLGRRISCGCSRIKNLIGKRFGRLLVLENTNKKKELNYVWKCLCDCGNICEIRGGCLTGGQTRSCGCLIKEINAKLCKQRSGENHYKWIKDRNKVNPRSRLTQKSFRQSIFNRDNFTCKKCNQYGGNLVAHHLDGYHWCNSKRNNINNGVTLCVTCHKKFHKLYGYQNNTKEQFIKYMDNYNE